MDVFILGELVLSYENNVSKEQILTDLFDYGTLCKCCISDIELVNVSTEVTIVMSLYHKKLERYITGLDIDKYFKDTLID